MSKIRVFLANRPRIMRELMRSIIERQPDMEVVGEVIDPLQLLLAAGETAADVIIVGIEGANEPGLCSHLLAEYPKMTILGVAPTGETAFIEQLCPWRQEIADPSAMAILNALRRAIRAPCSSEDTAS